jgi:hypothetical protein
LPHPISTSREKSEKENARPPEMKRYMTWFETVANHPNHLPICGGKQRVKLY